MAEQTTDEQELAKILTQCLDLEDINPADIDPEASLFGLDTPDSLGLDSIDALEISLAITQNYGIQLKADDENNQAIFSSLRSLASFITSQQ